MLFTTLLQRLMAGRGRNPKARSCRAKAARPRRPVLPRLELLEDRLVPAGSANPLGYDPDQIRSAYGFKDFTFNGVKGDGSGQTIAVVVAFDNPKFVNSTDAGFATSDLHNFDAAFGLPDPPSFTKVNQTGGNPNTLARNAGWAGETALDVEWAHALAPGANILLVEANDTANLWKAVKFAAGRPGVSVVSLSFSTPEFPQQIDLDSTYTTPAGHQGVTFVESTGDNGPPARYGSTSPNVLAVGGTSLEIDSAGGWESESGWRGSGGGPSRFELQPLYQIVVVPEAMSKTDFGFPVRTVPDVAGNADPNTGVAVYDSFNNGPLAPWDRTPTGGTSAAAPQWSALIAIADQGRVLAGAKTLDGPSQTLPAIYQLPLGDFHDITTGNNGYPAVAGYDLVTGRGSPRADRVINDLARYRPLADPGFELPKLGTGLAAYDYAPSGSPWKFLNGAGVAGNGSAFTAGNADAPQGTQVAFLQGGKFPTISQSVDFLAAGTYVISFSAAQRGNVQAGSLTIQVRVDGRVVATITPANRAYNTYTTASFAVTAGAHVISFVGLNPNGGDNTALIDRVTISASPLPLLADPGFEMPAQGNGFRYASANGQPTLSTLSPWSFTGNAGLSGNGSGFTGNNPAAPQGTQVAFLQNTGTISQTLGFAAGTYAISFSAAQRAGPNQRAPQTFQVQVDGKVVATVTPTGTDYATYTTPSFTVTAGAHTIAFVSTSPIDGDSTAFIDQVSIKPAN